MGNFPSPMQPNNGSSQGGFQPIRVTGPQQPGAQAPVAPPGYQPGPAVQPQAQPQPQPQVQPAVMPAPMPMDGAAPGMPLAAPDPQIQATISVYGYGLGSQDPIEVSAAIAKLESLGPAYREAAAREVLAQLGGGGQAMRTVVLIDALSRWGIVGALPRIAELTRDADPSVRKAAGEAYARLNPGGTMTPQGPGGPAGAPAYAMNGSPSTMSAQNLPPELVGIYERMRDPNTSPAAAMEFARLSGQAQAMVGNALLNDPKFMEDGRNVALLSAALAKNPRDPNVQQVLGRLASERYGGFMLKQREYNAARARAATALIYYGTPQQLPSVLRLIADEGVQHDFKKIVIDSLAQRQDLLNSSPAVVTVLKAVMDNQLGPAPFAAAHALSRINSPAAKEALGTSKILRGEISTAGNNERLWTLQFLERMPGPVSPSTIAVLQAMLKNNMNNEHVKKKAREILKKAGVQPVK